ncbi:hypothetical protein QJQ45_002203 [Haematococcus lacustris]|nr:hypothetical protein QJQ45_002203 [Haematococcus lacustris]
MAKKKRKGSDKKQKASRSRQGKQRQERRDGWTTRKRQVAPPAYVIKGPEGAVLRGCKKTSCGSTSGCGLKSTPSDRVVAGAQNLPGSYPTPGFPSAPQPPAVQPPQPPDAPPLPPLPPRAPAQPAPAQPASMECDTDSDSESDCDSEPEPQSDSESESEPEPVTQTPQRRCSARLAALAPAAPTGPPLPLDCEDPLMLRQLKDFCMFFANPTFKTCYNQLQRRLVRDRHPMPMPAFEDPSNQALLAKLHELGSINLAELGAEGATLDTGHVADLVEEANTHRRLLGIMKQGSLQDTLPLPCRMRHAVHVCRWLERWQQPPTPPALGQPKRGKRHGVGPRTLTCPPPFTLTPMARVGVHFIKVDSRVLHGVCKQLGRTKESRAAFTSEPALSQHWARWFDTKKVRNKEFAFERLVDIDGVSVCVHYTRPLPPPPAPPPAASSSSTSSRPSAAAAAAHAVGLLHIGKGIAETREFLFDPDTQIGVGIDPGVDPGGWVGGRLEEDMAEVSIERHGRTKQLVVFFGAATIGTGGGWGADAVLRACRKVVCRPRGTDQLRGRVVLVDEHRTSRVSSAVNGQQPCERQLNKRRATRPADWKPPAGQVDHRLVRPAWSQQRDQPVRGLMWCPVVAPRKPPQAPRSSQAATQPAASEPGPSTPPPAKRSKPAAEPTKGKA